MKKLTFLLALTAVLAGCKSDNPALTGVAPPAAAKIERGTIVASENGLTVEYDSRVDILFVIDDSASMAKHQENFSRNVGKFVDQLAKVKTIDFHVAYTTAFDSGRYGSKVPQECGGRLNFENNGSLYPLLGPAEKLPTDGRRYVTRDDDYTTILKDTLSPSKNTSLVKQLINTRNNPTADGCGYGPEEEEMFSPVLAALENKSLEETTNKGFRREGAFFVVILISDAKSADVNFGLTPEVVQARIAAATGSMTAANQRYRILSVAMKPGVRMDRNTCMPDYAFGEANGDGSTTMRLPRIVEENENPLAVLARDAADENSTIDPVLSICDDNYGDALALYGAQVQKDALRDVELQLPSLPQVFTNTLEASKNLKVMIGEAPLSKNFWKYSSQDGNGQGGVVTVFGQMIPWDQFPDAKINVKYTPVDAGASTTRALTR